MNKKKACSLKRRPTFYKAKSEFDEVEISIDIPNIEKTSSLSGPSTKSPEPSTTEEDTDVHHEVDVNVLDKKSGSFSKQNSFGEQSKVVDVENHISSDQSEGIIQRRSKLSSSLSMDDALDEEDAAVRLSRLPSLRGKCFVYFLLFESNNEFVLCSQREIIQSDIIYICFDGEGMLAHHNPKLFIYFQHLMMFRYTHHN